jgi:tetratricopeptide (TPR) repeat protein
MRGPEPGQGRPADVGALLQAKDANQSGIAEAASGRFDDAVADFERAKELDPLNPEYEDNRSKAMTGVSSENAEGERRRQMEYTQMEERAAASCRPKPKAA